MKIYTQALLPKESKTLLDVYDYETEKLLDTTESEKIREVLAAGREEIGQIPLEDSYQEDLAYCLHKLVVTCRKQAGLPLTVEEPSSYALQRSKANGTGSEPWPHLRDPSEGARQITRQKLSVALNAWELAIWRFICSEITISYDERLSADFLALIGASTIEKLREAGSALKKAAKKIESVK